MRIVKTVYEATKTHSPARAHRESKFGAGYPLGLADALA
jgi:hypothetical protein